MAEFLDVLEDKSDPMEALPKWEWQIMQRVEAPKDFTVPRWCKPRCEALKVDFDKYPLCYESCEFWIMDRHDVKKGEMIINLLFAIDINDPTNGFSTWIGEKYLRSLLGERWVNKMVDQHIRTFKDMPEEINEVQEANND